MDAGLQQIVETLPDGIVLLDQKWRLTFANPTARRLSRIRPEHMLGPTHWELYPETLGTPIEGIIDSHQGSMKLRRSQSTKTTRNRVLDLSAGRARQVVGFRYIVL